MKVAVTLMKGWVVVVFVLLQACQPSGKDSGVVLLGQASPLTGQQAAIGKDNEHGVSQAIAEINAAHWRIAGRPLVLKLDSEDDQADPRMATQVAQRFVDEGVVAVIGHLNSGTSIPAARIYAAAGIPEISPSATAVKLTQQGFKTTFRLMANDAQQGAALADYATGALHALRLAVIDDRTAYGQGLADQFVLQAQKKGAVVVARQYTDDKATDFTAILTQIAGMHPDLLFFGGMYGQAAPMVAQMAHLGMTQRLLGGDGMRTPEFIHLAGVHAEGQLASKPGVPIESLQKGKAFAAVFEQRYGKIQNYAPYAYDAVYVLVAAMQAAQSTRPADFLPYLAKTHEFDGVTGKISFDAHGDLVRGAVTLYQVRQGQWMPVKTVMEASQ